MADVKSIRSFLLFRFLCAKITSIIFKVVFFGQRLKILFFFFISIVKRFLSGSDANRPHPPFR